MGIHSLYRKDYREKMKKKKYLAIGGACVVLTLGAFFSTQNKGKSDDNQNISKAAGAVTNVENTTYENGYKFIKTKSNITNKVLPKTGY